MCRLLQAAPTVFDDFQIFGTISRNYYFSGHLATSQHSTQNKQVRRKLGENIQFVQLIFLQLFLTYISPTETVCCCLSTKNFLLSYSEEPWTSDLYPDIKLWLLEVQKSSSSSQSKLSSPMQMRNQKVLCTFLFLRMKASRLKEWKSLGQLC